LRILSLDWDTSYQRDLSVELEASGHQVVLFSRVADALAFDAEEPFDLVITETRLPDRSGLQFVRDLKQARGGSPPPVIFLTEAEQPEVRELCAGEGAARFLLKKDGWPTMIAEIYGVITELEPPAMPAPPTREALRADARVFRGNLETIEILDIIQLLNLGKKSGVLVLAAGPREGRVFFTDGEIVAAESEGESGVDAFASLFALKRGAFRFEAGPVEIELTIHQSTSSLMLDALRLQDEGGRSTYGGLPGENVADGEDIELESGEFDFEHEVAEASDSGWMHAGAFDSEALVRSEGSPAGPPAGAAAEGGSPAFHDDRTSAPPAAEATGASPRPQQPRALDNLPARELTREADRVPRTTSAGEKAARDVRRPSRSFMRPGRRFSPSAHRTAALVVAAVVAILASGYVVLFSGALRKPADSMERADYRNLMLEAAENQAKIDSLERLLLGLSNSVVGAEVPKDDASQRISLIQTEIRKATAERDAARLAAVDKGVPQPEKRKVGEQESKKELEERGRETARLAAAEAGGEPGRPPKPPAASVPASSQPPGPSTPPVRPAAGSDSGEGDGMGLVRIADPRATAGADTGAHSPASPAVSVATGAPPSQGASFSTVSPEPAAPAGESGPDFSLAAIRNGPQFVPVDSRPSPRNPLRPRYPKALADRKIGGTVTLWVLVSAAGRVEDVRVLRSAGHPELDKAAADAIRRAAYNPARRGGAPAPAWTQQQVAFKLE
jgi:protein TonB